MSLTLQEISDRFEIMDLLTAYSTAIDQGDIDALDDIFTTDARLDYSKAGGPCENLSAMKIFLKSQLGHLPRQHLITNHQIRIQGDEATVRCLCYNPLELPNNGTSATVMIWGLWYHDKFVRTAIGWRIKEKVTEPCYHWKFQRSDT